jgi:hypothetical protein
LRTAEKDKTRLYSEKVSASHCLRVNQAKRVQTVAHPSDINPPTFGLVVKAADEKTSSHETKRIIKETVDPKTLRIGVSKIKNLANEAEFVECRTEKDRDILEKKTKQNKRNIGGTTHREANYHTPQSDRQH